MRWDILTALLLVTQATHSIAQSSSATSAGAFVGITPGSTLAWIPCTPPANAQGPSNHAFECARLSVKHPSQLSTTVEQQLTLLKVPLDHLNSATDRRTIEIAVARVQARDKNNYQGPLFVNPGGPGDLGTDFLFKSADFLTQLVGPSYDIVSWDPRGVGSTVSPLACFPDEETRAQALEQEQHLWLFRDNTTLAQLATRMQATAQGCLQYSPDILPYIGTIASARDLYLMNRLYGFSDTLSYLYAQLILGYEEMECVLDVNRWFFDQQFLLTSYIDSDKVLDDFFNLCFLAGQSGCAFWHSSVASIRQAFITIDENIHKAPARVGPTRQLDWSQFRLYMWNALKSPVGSWSGGGGLDIFLSLLEKDELSALTAASADELFEYIAQGNHELQSNQTLIDPSTGRRNGGENAEVIAAVDNPYSFTDISTFLPFFTSQEVVKTGYLVQSILGTRGILSGFLKTASAERPTAPFANITTSYPLLFLSNLRDPITPLQDALNSSAIFADSVVLRANMSGHTTAAAPCKCANQAVYDYFNSEKLPRPETICQADVLPFGIVPTITNDASVDTS
ncbi:MAG: hypothetical protein Q9208_008005 [Pyrenodesmia sp. 3 TL-2023]